MWSDFHHRVHQLVQNMNWKDKTGERETLEGNYACYYTTTMSARASETLERLSGFDETNQGET